MQVNQRTTIREVATNGKWILGLNRNIEFPIAQRRRFDRIIRPLFHWLRGGATGQADWNQIDVLEKMTVGQRDISFYRRACDGSAYFQIRISPRGQGIVARD